jgi:hypothetical protein
VNQLALFLQYCVKVYEFNRHLPGLRNRRPYAVIPTRALFLTLFLGAVLRIGSYNALSAQTRRRRWQHLIHWPEPISHDALEYAAERFDLEDLRALLASINRQLKENKAFESCKINGLLFLSLDANEHFHSRSRCCPCCCERQIETTDQEGKKQSVIEYYHRYVFAQINGPKINSLLDLEPIRPGEEEAQAALRLLGRLRRVYGVRFFDSITVDAWYVQGPFLRAVEKLGWEWVVVLKQERMDVFKEAQALSRNRAPDLQFDDEGRGRKVRLWQLKDLTFSEGYGSRPVSVVRSEEQWTEKKVIGGAKHSQPQTNRWLWMQSEGLGAYSCDLTYHAGHRRWGIENKAFNELTQSYHLEHCYHHEPVAMLAQMLVLLIAFTLFQVFATLHSQLVRLGKTTLKQLAHRMDLDLQEDLPWNLWFESG